MYTMRDSHILLPSKLKVVSETDDSGVYEIEGLYPGYGHTLGNSLRRIILSSLPGVSVTSLKIAGADHEFSTLDGVKEDVLNIILNLKRVRFRLDGDEAQTATLSIKSPKQVTAADIETPGQLEVLNGDLPIAEVTAKGSGLEVEMTVQKGLGFVPREMHSKEKMGIGAISVDAMYTPIRKVSYEVENMRVGDRTDHNRLRMSIQTDGSMTAREALEEAIKIMIMQLRTILDLKEEPFAFEEPSTDHPELDAPVAEGDDQSGEELMDVLKTRVDKLELSTRTLNALDEAGIRTIGGLVRKTETDILELEGIGEKGVQEIKDVLKTFDLDLKE